jgi:hypothetical protein
MNGVQLNKYSVQVLADQVNNTVKNNKKYIMLPLHSEYKLLLNNYSYARCEVKIYVDGLHVGTWQMDGFSTMVIDRPWFSPINIVNGKFRFTNPYSDKLFINSIQKKYDTVSNLGIIKVVFIPESSVSTKVDMCIPAKIPPATDNNNKLIEGIEEKFSYGNNYIKQKETNHNQIYRESHVNLGRYKGPKDIINIDEDNITVIILKLMIDSRFFTPFITQNDVDVLAALDKPPNLNTIPPDRTTEDFYLFNRILRY